MVNIINTADGLVNGATAVLMSIDFERDSSNPKTLWLKFSDENVGRETRRKKPHRTEPSWTPIDKCTISFQFKRNDQISIELCQFLLVVAEAMTVHLCTDC